MLRQLSSALAYLHQECIVHRDVKPANCLFNDDNTVKLSDFGSCAFVTGRTMTSNVTTVPYQAPEMLLGSDAYGYEVDVWSLGCLYDEMRKGATTFAYAEKDDEVTLLDIFCRCGTPTTASWPNVAHLPKWKADFPIYPPRCDLRGPATRRAMAEYDFVSTMLNVNPSERPTSRQVAMHFGGSVVAAARTPAWSDPFASQTSINRRMHPILNDWLLEVSRKFKFDLLTYHYAVALVQSYLRKKRVERSEYQLVGICCLSIASKLNELTSAFISDYVYICDKAYSAEQVKTTEQDICLCTALDFVEVPYHKLALEGALTDQLKYLATLWTYTVQDPTVVLAALREYAATADTQCMRHLAHWHRSFVDSETCAKGLSTAFAKKDHLAFLL